MSRHMLPALIWAAAVSCKSRWEQHRTCLAYFVMGRSRDTMSTIWKAPCLLFRIGFWPVMNSAGKPPAGTFACFVAAKPSTNVLISNYQLRTNCYSHVRGSCILHAVQENQPSCEYATAVEKLVAPGPRVLRATPHLPGLPVPQGIRSMQGLRKNFFTL